jgi:hypothetical protein
MRDAKKRVRLTVDLKPQFYERLTQLEERVGANTKADLIRDALRIYELLARELQAGRKICSVDGEGGSRELLFVAPMPDVDVADRQNRRSV